MKKLEIKVAGIYGDGAVAKAFACEGARVFLTGRTPTKLEAIAKEILSVGGSLETSQLDALDEQAVEKHIDDFVRKVGKIDISSTPFGIPQKKGIQGIPLRTFPGEFSIQSRDNCRIN
jgi:NADP-dependent 3-hydroxy acid dehydrogenase YdfG